MREVSSNEPAPQTTLRDLQNRHEARLRSQALDLTGNRDDAEDLLQDLWLRVWLHLPTLRSPNCAGAFLAQTLLRLAANRRRFRSRRIQACSLEEFPADDGLAIADHLASDVESPEQQFLRRTEAAEASRVLEGLLSRLARKHPAQAEAIILHDLEQRPYGELAGKDSTWRTRRDRGLDWLRANADAVAASPQGRSC